MRHALFLAFRYMRSAPFRSLIVVIGLGTALFLPIFSFWIRPIAERNAS